MMPSYLMLNESISYCGVSVSVYFGYDNRSLLVGIEVVCHVCFLSGLKKQPEPLEGAKWRIFLVAFLFCSDCSAEVLLDEVEENVDVPVGLFLIVMRML